MFTINAEQEKKLNRANKANQDAKIGTIMRGLAGLTKVSHTIVAGDVGATDTVVELTVEGTPVCGIFTVINDTGVEVSGYTIAFLENKATVTIAKASLPVDGKVFAILW
jgi:hypothetical protein